MTSFDAMRVFVGKSPENQMTTFSGGYGAEFDGNSILVQIAPLEYVFIGNEIFRFTALHPIQAFVSPVGNSDVPYPYAIDTESYHYLLIEDMILKCPSGDPYNHYYAHGLMTADRAYCPPKLPA